MTKRQRRDGQWIIANNGFPTLADSPKGIPGGLQKGDIIFNHKQAEEILKHGFVTGSHAKLVGGGAHASGTVVGGRAFADRVSTFVPVKAPAAQSSASVSAKNVSVYAPSAAVASSTTTVKAEKQKADNDGEVKKKKKKQSILDAEQIDWIEVRLKRIDAELEKIKTTAESTFTSFITRLAKVEKEMGKIAANIKQYEKGAKRYETEAGRITFTPKERKAAKDLGVVKKGSKNVEKDIKKKAVEGAIDISTIYANVSDAQKARDNAKKADEKKSTKKTRKALKKANDLLKEEKAKESLKKKIELYQQWMDKADEAKVKIEELKAEERELYKQRFDMTKEQWEDELDILSDHSDMLNTWIDTQEAKGEFSGAAIFDALSKNEKKRNDALKAELKDLEDQLKAAYNSEKIEKGSADWYEMNDAIREVNKSLAESNKQLAEYQKKIDDFNYESFKVLQERVSNASGEYQFLVDLMSDEKMVSDKGFITEYGVATLGAYAAQMEIAKRQAAGYAEQIDEIEKAIGNGTPTKAQADRLAELRDAQQSVIKTQHDMLKSIRSLVEDGWKKEIDSIKDAVSEYEKMLDTQKSEYDYSKKITEQQEKITSLRRQLAAWGSVDTEEGSAKRQKTAKELRDAEQELEESQEERRISQIKEMLSDLSDEYEKLMNERLDKISTTAEAILDSINAFQGNIGTTLSDVADKYGLSLSKEVKTSLDNMSKEVKQNLGDLETTGIPVSNLTAEAKTITDALGNVTDKTTVSNIGAKIDTIVTKLGETLNVQIDNADKSAKDTETNVNKQTTPYGGNTSKGGGSDASNIKSNNSKKATAPKQDAATNKAAAKIVASTKRLLNPSSSSGNGVASKIKSADEVRKFINAYASKATKKKSSYSDVNKVVYGLTGGKVLSANELKDLAKRLGIKYDNASKSGSLYKKLKKLKASGFRSGKFNVPDDDYFWTQEGYGQNELIQRKSDGAMLTRLGKGDMVFNADMTKTLWNFAKNPAPYMNAGTFKAPDVSSNVTYGDTDVDITFNLPDVTNAEDFMRTLQKSKKFEQLVQSMTIGQLKGKGTLNKYTTRI